MVYPIETAMKTNSCLLTSFFEFMISLKVDGGRCIYEVNPFTFTDIWLNIAVAVIDSILSTLLVHHFFGDDISISSI